MATNLRRLLPSLPWQRRARSADGERGRRAPAENGRALGWEAQVRFADGLRRTVDWYRDNAWWWEPIRSGDYRAYYERQYGRALG